MVNALGVLGLVAVTAALVRVDRRVWGTAITPGVLLVGGYTIIAALILAARRFYGFAELHAATYGVLALLGLLCTGASIAAAAAMRWSPAELRLPIRSDGRLARGVLLTVGALFVPLAIRTVMAEGQLWSSESVESLGYGLLGHLHVALAFATVWYAVSSQDRGTKRLLVLAGAILALSLYPVKGWTLIPLTAVVLARLYRGEGGRSRVRYALALPVAGVAVFFGIYASRAQQDPGQAEGIAALLPAILEHFVFYLTAGMMGLDAVLSGLRLQGGVAVIFAPFVNVWRAMAGSGSYVNIISGVYVDGMTEHVASGNVFSYVGSLIGHSDPFLGMTLAVLFVVLGYAGLAIAWRSGAGSLRAGALYVNATFAFGWFEYYLWHLVPYEILGLALLFAAPHLLRRTADAQAGASA